MVTWTEPLDLCERHTERRGLRPRAGSGCREGVERKEKRPALLPIEVPEGRRAVARRRDVTFLRTIRTFVAARPSLCLCARTTIASAKTLMWPWRTRAPAARTLHRKSGGRREACTSHRGRLAVERGTRPRRSPHRRTPAPRHTRRFAGTLRVARRPRRGPAGRPGCSSTLVCQRSSSRLASLASSHCHQRGSGLVSLTTAGRYATKSTSSSAESRSLTVRDRNVIAQLSQRDAGAPRPPTTDFVSREAGPYESELALRAISTRSATVLPCHHGQEHDCPP